MRSAAPAALVAAMVYFVAITAYQSARGNQGVWQQAFLPTPAIAGPESTGVPTSPRDGLGREGAATVLPGDDSKPESRLVQAELGATPRGACRAFLTGALLAIGEDGSRARRSGTDN